MLNVQLISLSYTTTHAPHKVEIYSLYSNFLLVNASPDQLTQVEVVERHLNVSLTPIAL